MKFSDLFILTLTRLSLSRYLWKIRLAACAVQVLLVIDNRYVLDKLYKKMVLCYRHLSDMASCTETIQKWVNKFSESSAEKTNKGNGMHARLARLSMSYKCGQQKSEEHSIVSDYKQLRGASQADDHLQTLKCVPRWNMWAKTLKRTKRKIDDSRGWMRSIYRYRSGLHLHIRQRCHTTSR
jgi:transposase-like protein